uniref:Uncharacterized protein n=1 Tax=Neosartorya fischeri (strain ATCC 1020 / DSM 3700 / CBS 544.65 / FGSC A1164 / JCM 1740 / NRRL 181 / WB 181) TaxID=331117 RepID=H9CNP7_NEOFI|nr:hypothetical protein NFIA_m0370 [Aspergillus fischeri]
MYYQSIQFNPFQLVSPWPWPVFTSISLFFNNLFVGLQNILSSFINNNLWYCYLFLIFIFSILLAILLFILVIQTQKGYSVKMNNLPKNENSKKRKRKSENGNSRKKGKSENGDSGSPDKNENKPKPKVFFPKEDEETQSYKYYMQKYDICVKKNELCPRGTRKEVEDNFHNLYSEYKKHKPTNPDLDWEKLTEVYYSTWDRQPFGNRRYADTERGFEQAYEYMKNKARLIEMGHSKGKILEASALWKKALGNVEFTTFKKYIEILDIIVNKRGR